MKRIRYCLESLKIPLRVALYEMKTLLFSLKFLILSLVSWIFMDMFIMEIRKFAQDYNLSMVPAVLPFYFSDFVYCNIAFLLLIFLLSDMPLRGKNQGFLLSRCGCSLWGMGQLFAIIGVTAVFVLEQFLFSVLVSLPCLEFTGWGKVWGSVASGTMLELGYGSYVSVSWKVISTYTPWQAVGISCLLFWLTGICYGMLEFFLNGISRDKLGTILLSVWSLAWLFLEKLGGIPEIRAIGKFSPQGWNDLSGKTVSDAVGTAAWFVPVLILLFIWNWQAVKRRKILTF